MDRKKRNRKDSSQENHDSLLNDENNLLNQTLGQPKGWKLSYEALRKKQKIVIKNASKMKDDLKLANEKIAELLEKDDKRQEELNLIKEEMKMMKEELEKRRDNSSSTVSSDLVKLYDGSNIEVNKEKFFYCTIDSWMLYCTRILTLICPVRELYRTSVFGKSQIKNYKKRPLNSQKLNEIYELIKIKFPKFCDGNKEKNKWKSLLNKELNDKLSALNRYFTQLKDNMEREDDQQTKRYCLTRDDRMLLTDVGDFEENPRMFLDLDLEIDNVSCVFEEIANEFDD